VRAALVAGEALDATVVNMRFVKPLDEALLLTLAAEHDALVTVEENVVAGGAGSAVAELLSAAGVARPIVHLGFPDRIVDHGDPALLMAQIGLDAPGIEATIRARLGALLG
jgi:1-deoxy-D-xylulose-5-phosphate synthase